MIEASVSSTGEDSSAGVHLSGRREVSKNRDSGNEELIFGWGGKEMSENGGKMQVTGST